MATTEEFDVLTNRVELLTQENLDLQHKDRETEAKVEALKEEMEAKIEEMKEEAQAKLEALIVETNAKIDKHDHELTIQHTLGIKRDDTVNDIMNNLIRKQEEMQGMKEEIEKLKTNAKELATGDKPKGPRSNLVHPKETSVDKLPETISRADFVNWIDELHMHLDGMSEWTGISTLLKKVRAETEVVTPIRLEEIATNR